MQNFKESKASIVVDSAMMLILSYSLSLFLFNLLSGQPLKLSGLELISACFLSVGVTVLFAVLRAIFLKDAFSVVEDEIKIGKKTYQLKDVKGFRVREAFFGAYCIAYVYFEKVNYRFRISVKDKEAICNLFSFNAAESESDYKGLNPTLALRDAGLKALTLLVYFIPIALIIIFILFNFKTERGIYVLNEYSRRVTIFVTIGVYAFFVLFFLGFAVYQMIRYSAYNYSVSDKGIYVKYGKHDKLREITAENVTAVLVKRNLFEKIFQLYRIRIVSKIGVSLALPYAASKDVKDEILNALMPNVSTVKPQKVAFCANLTILFLLVLIALITTLFAVYYELRILTVLVLYAYFFVSRFINRGYGEVNDFAVFKVGLGVESTYYLDCKKFDGTCENYGILKNDAGAYFVTLYAGGEENTVLLGFIDKKAAESLKTKVKNK